ncbi:MAG TPA: TIM barrel protein [Candidatus Hydrogenedentes bacterium]|nr:TIM barrel protein [Candidatus Hydrogenedentota bacterium]HOS01713.1 TIM barrel protein [Candidatus Hydrogenedentota bacterium]
MRRKNVTRRDFLKTTSLAGMGAAVWAATSAAEEPVARTFDISLAMWSLHRTVGGKPGQLAILDVPGYVRQEFGIAALELVSGMMPIQTGAFRERKAFLDAFARAASDHDVKLLLIMVDGQGHIGAAAEEERRDAVERHRRMIDFAHYLGCHSIRMNWTGYSDNALSDPIAMKEFVDRSVKPLRALCDHGEKRKIHVLIENHGGPSSRPEALIQLIAAVNHDRLGTLPDFGNFPDDVDRYLGVDLMMSYAKAVSAKCYDFDPQSGRETTLDFDRLLRIVVGKHGYRGHIGIEFEGGRLSEPDGVKACKALLETLRG